VTTPDRSQPPSSERVAALRAAVAEQLPQALADLAALVAIPGISADPSRSGDLSRSAEAVAELFGGLGVGHVEVCSAAGGAPAVLARLPGPAGTRTVLLYAHHDVQPTGNRAAWTTDPFTATERDGRLYGRGTADDKAGIAVHLAALRALLAVDGELPVGISVFIEGEEESGSPSLEPFLSEYSDALAADVLVIADAANWQVGTPALTTSLRGLVDCTVQVSTLSHGVHSGMYGGPVPDALSALCRLLASLHDTAGNVAIAGLVSDPGGGPGGELPPDFRVDAAGTAVSGLEPVPAEGPELTESEFRAGAGLLDDVQLIGDGSITERLWSRPAVTVLGIDATPADEAANVLTPSARAKVSLRIPPGQDPADAMRALSDHLLLHAPWGARVIVEPGGLGQAWAAEAAGADSGGAEPGGAVLTAAQTAFSQAFGTQALLIGSGGSIPLVAAYTTRYPEAEVVVTAVEDPATRAHSNDESLHLGDFGSAVLGHVLLLDALGQV